jgi:hypothetical protein
VRSRSFLVVVTLVLAMSCASQAAEETPKPMTFAQAVIAKAVSFMPDDVKAKLVPVEKDMVTAAKSVLAPKVASQQVCYYVEDEKGSGASTLAEQFRIVRKNVGEHKAYSDLAPSLGKLAGTVIALCGPHHTDESVFKAAAHTEFDKSLDAAAGTLKADNDGNQKVDNPSEFAIQLAKRSNELLTKLSSSEAADVKGVPSEVFSLAANGIADCWWTLLVPEKTQSTGEAAVEGDFIGNKRSLKFHLPTCKFLPAEKNRVPFKTREEAVNEGYVPCKVCKP